MRHALGVMLLFLAGAANAVTVTVEDPIRVVSASLNGPGPSDGVRFEDTGYWDSSAYISMESTSESVTAVMRSSEIQASGEYDNYSMHIDGYGSLDVVDRSTFYETSQSDIWLQAQLIFSEDVIFSFTCDSQVGATAEVRIVDSWYTCGQSGLLSADASHHIHLRARLYLEEGDVSYDIENAQLSFTASAVPIPAAVWLFGSALAGLGWMRRRKTA
jgi:hypothetical protein